MTDSLGDASDYVRQSGDFGINKYAFMDGCSRDIQEGIRPALPDGLRLRHQRFQLLINLAEGFPLRRIVGHTAIVRAMGLFKRQRLQQPGAVCLVVNRQLRQPWPLPSAGPTSPPVR